MTPATPPEIPPTPVNPTDDPFLAVTGLLERRRTELNNRMVRAPDFYKESPSVPGLARVTYSKSVSMLQQHGVREGQHPFASRRSTSPAWCPMS